MHFQKTPSPDTAPLSRRGFLSAAGALAATAVASRATARIPAQESRPNIVLIIVDTLRADALGCYGSTVGASPELDALAAEGVQFNNVTACSSWTLSSIGAMITGRYPRSLGLYHSTDYLQDIAPSIAQQLKSVGYKTYGVTANAMINSIAGFSRGFDHYQDAEVNWQSKGRRTVPSDVVYADTLKLLADKGEAPAYVQVNIMETHEYYRGDGVLTRPEFSGLFPEVTKDAHRREYFQSLRQASIDTAAFITELRTRPGWSDTVFIVLGDHGEGLNDHPRVWMSSGHGTLLYRSMIGVPMIWHYPGGSFVPSEVFSPVSLLDVAPAILELAGAALPGNLDGVSLTPFLYGNSIPAVRPAIVTETYGTGIEKIACHSTAWSYVHNRDFHAGCREYELQRVGAFVDGKHTDISLEHPDVTYRLSTYIKQWEEAHPKVPAVKVSDVSDPGTRKLELEALGYI